MDSPLDQTTVRLVDGKREIVAARDLSENDGVDL